jgi:hypothetical protein
MGKQRDESILLHSNPVTVKLAEFSVVPGI